MKWLEISVTTAPQAVDAIAHLFFESRSGGVAEETAGGGCIRVRAYLPTGAATAVTLQHIRDRIRALPSFGLDAGPARIDVREIEDEDWAAAWKSGYTAFAVGRIWITPTWEYTPPPPGTITVMLDPGMAFGSGLHPSTQLCLTALADRLRGGERVFDVGTGSGILAIAAAKLGASSVVAIDNDAVAVETARANIQGNAVSDRVEVREGSLLTGVDGRAAVMVANLTADLHVEFLPAAAEHLVPGGTLLLSGIVRDRVAEVEATARAAGLQIVDRVRSGEWECLILTNGNREPGTGNR